MFFTEWATPCAGQVTSKGVVTEYSTDLSATNSTNMAAGASGADWFVTDYSGIGEISSKGKIKLYSFADEGTQPLTITRDQTATCGSSKGSGRTSGKITPGGEVTEYSTGLGNSYSFGIATGSDGRIWFADNGNNSIGAITTDGTKLSDYTQGFTGDPVSITAGPDGNLYFGETTPVIGRITPDGCGNGVSFSRKGRHFPRAEHHRRTRRKYLVRQQLHSQVGMAEAADQVI